jgi:hypothetical protein
MEEETTRAYRDLDRRMQALAESDGDVYLPNPEPLARVDYILICMEPSLGHWARSKEQARARVASGFRNFLADIEPMLLHFSVRRFLCEEGQRYHITDFSKGAMLGKHAGAVRVDRYDRWYALLQEEIDLIAAPGACVIAVGKAVAEHLRRREFPREVTPVIHYSPLAGRARSARLEGHEDGFRAFGSSISSKDVLATAHEVLEESGVPPEIYREALTRVARSQLSESRRKLVYCYKLDFEAMKAGPRRDPAAFLANVGVAV